MTSRPGSYLRRLAAGQFSIEVDLQRGSPAQCSEAMQGRDGILHVYNIADATFKQQLLVEAENSNVPELADG